MTEKTFILDDQKFSAVPATKRTKSGEYAMCTGCYFDGKARQCIEVAKFANCCARFREDKTDIIWVRVPRVAELNRPL